MRKYKYLILTLLVMLLWGTLFPLVKLGYAAYDIKTVGDILLFAGVRFTICGAVICLFAYLTDQRAYRLTTRSVMPILLSGLFAIILHYGFTYSALKLTTSSQTAILKQIGVLLYVCFSFVFFKNDKPTWQKLMGAALGFFGIIAINYGKGGVSFNLGDLLIILASFCTVFANVISKKALMEVKPVTLTGLSQLFGGIVLLASGAVMGGGMSFPLAKWYIFTYICLASIFSYCLWFYVVKSGELSKLFIIKFAEPVFACIFGALLLGENILRLQYLAAFLLISGGIVLANIRKTHA